MLCKRWRRPLTPETVVSSMAETLKSYGVREVHGDQYAGEWVPAAFLRHGITYKPSELTRSEIYLEVLPLFSQGRIELLDLPVLAHAAAAAGAAHAGGRSRQRRSSARRA